MEDIIKGYLGQAKIGRKQAHKNLAIFPLLSTYFLDLEYLLLDEALSEDLIQVVEVDKEGSVPELKVINKSPQMILILDGEELVSYTSIISSFPRACATCFRIYAKDDG